MKAKLRSLLCLLVLCCSGLRNADAQGTAFTYQGRLNVGGAPATGNYDFRFRLAADPLANNYVGSPFPTNAVPVTGGLFTVTLDFGTGIFNGSNCWLEVDVRTNGAGSYTVLTPLQAVAPSPYAEFANSASNLSGTLPAGQINGTVSSANIAGTYGNALVLNNAANSFTGSFNGNGANVSNVNAAALNGLNATNFWQLGGNNVAAGQFIGSTNTKPVEIWAGGARALRLEPNSGNPPNVIGGSSNNYVSAGVYGATIGGGGKGGQSNSVFAIGGTIGGGFNNVVSNYNGTVGGGINNTASGNASYVGGGSENLASSDHATVTGGQGNVAGGDHSVIAGGNLGTASGTYAFIGGGDENSASGYFGVVAGGDVNSASGFDSAIGGGANNLASGYYATIPGGVGNVASGIFSFAAGNLAFATNQGAFVWADSQYANFGSSNNDSFSVRAQGGARFVTGGAGMTIDGQPVLTTGSSNNGIAIQTNTNGAPSIIEGSSLNYVASGVVGATIGGGGAVYYYGSTYSNSVTGDFGTVGGGRQNIAGTDSVVGGGDNNNAASGHGSTVAGGYYNTASFSASTVGGGEQNQATFNYAVVAGGTYNTASGQSAFVGGGGWDGIKFAGNTASGNASVVGGGVGNTASGNYAVVPGGSNNLASGTYSFAAGQQARALNQGAFVLADSQNAAFASTNNDSFNVRAQGGARFVTSGAGMTIDGQQVLTTGSSTSGISVQTNSINAPNVILGSSLNYVASGVVGAAIGGGGSANFKGTSYSNSIVGGYGTIGGGYQNVASTASFVGGGGFNTASGSSAVVAGGAENTANGNEATVGGGAGNIASGFLATVPGGYGNIASGSYSFAAGQQAQATNQGAFVWADSQNAVFSSTANDQFLVRAQGGVGINTSQTTDNNFCINTNTYLFSHSLYLRGDTTSDHNHGLAYCGFTVTNFNTTLAPDGPVLWGFTGGALATRNGNAAMLSWNSTGVSINATNNLNGATFFVNGNRSGGFGNAVAIIQNTNGSSSEAPALRIVGTGVTASGILSVSSQNPQLTGLLAQFGNSNSFVVAITNDGTIYCKATVLTSDRNAKENFTPLDAKEVLAKVASLPVTEWNYKDDSTDKKHIGPVAQDFQAAFGLNGRDDRHISVVDESGVALAAIQGLNQKVDELGAELKRRDDENAELKARLSALEQLVQKSK